MRTERLRAGIFLAPYHPVDESPTLAFERDLETVRYLDELGYAEAWFGEHHSAAYEISGSPELMIAAAAQRTKRIKLGTGVVSLPYHNPLTVANRIAQLDHLTFGRLIFGAGPGLLVSDAHMMGLDPHESRRKLDHGIGVIRRLLAGEWVTERYEGWYDLQDAHCQVLPYQQQELELCVASTFSATGGMLAAKYDAGMLCFASTLPGGYDMLSGNWNHACAEARKFGRELAPSSLRCVTDMHIAETREQAMAEVRAGYERNTRYFKNQSASLKDSPANKPLEQLIAEGQVVIGTPDDAIAQIRRLEEKVPDFGCVLLCEKNWAEPAQQRRSYELFARFVLPAINRDNRVREESFAWAGKNGDRFMEIMMAASRSSVVS